MRRNLLFSFILILILVSSAFASNRPKGTFEAHFVYITIGRDGGCGDQYGDAVLYKSPNDHWALFDAGADDQATERLIPYMQALGVTHLDYAFLSHYHADHCQGFTEIINAGITIGTLYDRGGSDTGGGCPDYPPYGANRQTIQVGDHFEMDGVHFTCFVRGLEGHQGTSENTNSVVLKITYGKLDIYQAGDCEKSCLDNCIAISSLDNIEVYQANHHGGPNANDLDFLQYLDYEAMVIQSQNYSCVGQACDGIHPNAEVQSRYENFLGDNNTNNGDDPDEGYWHCRYQGNVILTYNCDETQFSMYGDGNTSPAMACIGGPFGPYYFDIDIKEADYPCTATNQSPNIVLVDRNPTTPNFTQNVIISADITDDSAVSDANLYYKINSGTFTEIAMSLISGTNMDGTWEYDAIPAQTVGDTVNYYVEAIDDSSAISTNPPTAPNALYTYVVSDTANQPPEIIHTEREPVTPTEANSVIVSSNVRDDRGISSVKLYYQINSGDYTIVDMILDSGTNTDGVWKYDAIPMQIPSTAVNYYIIAEDNKGLTVNDPIDAPSSVYAYTVVEASSGEALDISGWTLQQYGSEQSFTLPADTEIPANGYLIIGRNATQTEFESFWGALPDDGSVIYVNSGESCPMINGGETYELHNESKMIIDGPTPSLTTSGSSNHRNNPGDDASSVSSWITLSDTEGTPGLGAGIPSDAGVVINEIADAGGAGNFIYEFVELYYDSPPTYAIELASYNTIIEDNRIIIKWVFRHQAVRGFNIYRKEEFWNTWVKLNRNYITSRNTKYVWSDDDIIQGKTYQYKIEYRGHNGYKLTLAKLNVTSRLLPQAILYTNYPNPFNPETTLCYDLDVNLHTKLLIYNIQGELVRTLVDEMQTAGTHNIIWNGTDNENNPLPSGVYIYKLEAGEFSDSRNMVLLK